MKLEIEKIPANVLWELGRKKILADIEETRKSYGLAPEYIRGILNEALARNADLVAESTEKGYMTMLNDMQGEEEDE